MTEDRALLHGGGKIDAVDLALLNPDPASGRVISSVEELMELGRQAKARYDEFEAEIQKTMTMERARRVRQLRVNDGYSWRAVARQTAYSWGPKDAQWEPVSNQLAGIALCKIAADMLGENADDEPWN